MAKLGKKSKIGADLWEKYSCSQLSEEEKIADIYRACKEGKLNAVKILVNKGKVDVNEVSEGELQCQGLTLLHVVARNNHVDCLKYLLSVGANVDAGDAFGFRPIHDAALYGHTECLVQLLKYNALTTGVNKPQMEHITPLYYAAQQNHIECIKLLIKCSEYPERLLWDMGSKRGNVSLMDLMDSEDTLTSRIGISSLDVQRWLRNSALCGHVDYLDRLKKYLKRDFKPVEMLHSVITATQHGNLEYLKCLLEEQGMDPNVCTEDKITAMHYAARYGHKECIELLVKHGGNLNSKTSSNWTPLHVAVRQGCLTGVETLIECGCDIDQTGGDENDTAVHLALKIPSAEVIMKALLEGGPSLTLRNDDGKLPTEIKSEFDTLNSLVLHYALN